MITSVVFSRDRACQLDLMLRSLQKHSRELDINVLYLSSNEKFQQGYDKVIEMYPSVNFVNQSSFKSDTMSIIREGGDYTILFTDDDIVFGDIPPEENIQYVFDEVEPMSVSLRLGLNTVMQDPYEKTMADMPRRFDPVGEFLIWDIRNVGNFDIIMIVNKMYKQYRACNFTMPVSLDGHIYRKNVLESLLGPLNFKCPNTMELEMAGRNTAPFETNLMACLENSIVVNSPNNKVQTLTGTFAGEIFHLDIEELNEEFLNGKRLDGERVYNINVMGCHQEINLEMV